MFVYGKVTPSSTIVNYGLHVRLDICQSAIHLIKEYPAFCEEHFGSRDETFPIKLNYNFLLVFAVVLIFVATVNCAHKSLSHIT